MYPQFPKHRSPGGRVAPQLGESRIDSSTKDSEQHLTSVVRLMRSRHRCQAVVCPPRRATTVWRRWLRLRLATVATTPSGDGGYDSVWRRWLRLLLPISFREFPGIERTNETTSHLTACDFFEIFLLWLMLSVTIGRYWKVHRFGPQFCCPGILSGSVSPSI